MYFQKLDSFDDGAGLWQYSQLACNGNDISMLSTRASGVKSPNFILNRVKIQRDKDPPSTHWCIRVHLLQEQQPFNGRLSGTTRVGRYQKKHSPAHTHPGQHTSFITFLHLQRSTASSLFSLRA